VRARREAGEDVKIKIAKQSQIQPTTISAMISVIIPALNEEGSLAAMLEAVRAAGECEIIVVDGGSADRTRAIAARYGTVLGSAPGRAVQMNRGAKESSGEVLLFLHADVVFPPNGLAAIARVLTDPSIAGGNFDIEYEGNSFSCRIFTRINRWRRPFGIFYGDSGIFVRREVFEQLGGYRSLPLMEDYDFARRLVRRGRTVCLKESLTVSARRWEEYGLLRTTAAWFFLHVFYYLGVPTRWWRRLYPDIRRKPAASPAPASHAAVKCPD
jgi:rSAM/selenodomain-associated transferase 2